MAEIKEKPATILESLRKNNPDLEAKIDTPEVLVTLARAAETAERYEDMCVIMGRLIELNKAAGAETEVDSRNMLSVAYKNVVGQLRSARRRKDEDVAENVRPEDKEAYFSWLESQLEVKCKEVLKLLNDNLIEFDKINKWIGWIENNVADKDKVEDSEVEAQVFYLKMCGDYYRYLAESMQQTDAKEDNGYAEKATNHYECAGEIASLALAPTHPTRLGLALNASVCYYEIMNDAEKACALAKKAFDEAIQKLDSLSDATYKDSTLIMQLLRDNLTIWNSSDAQQADKNNMA